MCGHTRYKFTSALRACSEPTSAQFVCLRTAEAGFDFNAATSAGNAAFTASSTSTFASNPAIKPSNSAIRASDDTPTHCHASRESWGIPHTPRDSGT